MAEEDVYGVVFNDSWPFNNTLNETQGSEWGKISQYLVMGVTSGVLFLIILATVIGNVFVIAAVFFEKNLQSVANYLIVSLAVADLMVACLVMPLSAVYEVNGNWILGQGLCDMWTSSDVLCCTASILHLVAIAVDRYWAVTDIEYIRSRNRGRIVSMIVLVWAVAAVVSLAPILGWKDPNDINRVELTEACIVSQDVFYQIFATCATFYVPLVVILLLYWRIWETARNRIRHRVGRIQSQAVAPDAASQRRRCYYLTCGCCCGSSSSSWKCGASACAGDASSDGCIEDGGSGESTHLDNNRLMSTTMSDLHGTTFSRETTELSINPSPANLTPTTPVVSVVEINTVSGCVEQNGGGGAAAASPLLLAPSPTSTEVTINAIVINDSSKTLLNLEDHQQLHLKTSLSTSALNSPSRSSPIGGPKSSGGRLNNHLNHHTPNNSSSKHSKKKESIEAKRERKAAKTLAIITGAFVVCWLPFFVQALTMAICGAECELPRWIGSTFLWLGYFNSTLNPIIYTLFSPEFRQAFKRILCGSRARIRK